MHVLVLTNWVILLRARYKYNSDWMFSYALTCQASVQVSAAATPAHSFHHRISLCTEYWLERATTRTRLVGLDVKAAGRIFILFLLHTLNRNVFVLLMLLQQNAYYLLFTCCFLYVAYKLCHTPQSRFLIGDINIHSPFQGIFHILRA